MEAILTDPENSSRTGAEVAELVIEALTDYVKQIRADEVDRIARQVVDSIEGEQVGGIPARVADAIDDMRSVTHRLAVVGQIKYGPQGPTHTVVLGPFRSPVHLASEEQLRAALRRPCAAARDAGGHLAWDTKTGKGRGRFMLAPAFLKPRDAWDFYRGEGPADAVAQMVEHLPREVGPTCICGLPPAPPCRFCLGEMERRCPRHDPGEPHRCRRAA
ncbi:hypothetical protein ACWC0A_30375 [Streptomyces scopuliridis]